MQGAQCGGAGKGVLCLGVCGTPSLPSNPFLGSCGPGQAASTWLYLGWVSEGLGAPPGSLTQWHLGRWTRKGLLGPWPGVLVELQGWFWQLLPVQSVLEKSVCVFCLLLMPQPPGREMHQNPPSRNSRTQGSQTPGAEQGPGLVLSGLGQSKPCVFSQKSGELIYPWECVCIEGLFHCLSSSPRLTGLTQGQARGVCSV